MEGGLPFERGPRLSGMGWLGYHWAGCSGRCGRLCQPLQDLLDRRQLVLNGIQPLVTVGDISLPTVDVLGNVLTTQLIDFAMALEAVLRSPSGCRRSRELHS